MTSFVRYPAWIPAETVRDFCTRRSLSFTKIKPLLQELADVRGW